MTLTQSPDFIPLCFAVLLIGLGVYRMIYVDHYPRLYLEQYKWTIKRLFNKLKPKPLTNIPYEQWPSILLQDQYTRNPESLEFRVTLLKKYINHYKTTLLDLHFIAFDLPVELERHPEGWKQVERARRILLRHRGFMEEPTANVPSKKSTQTTATKE